MSYQWGSGYQGRSHDTIDIGSGNQGGSNDTADSGSGHQWRSYDTVDSGSGHLGGSYSVKANNSHGMRLHNYKGPYDRNKLRIARDDLMGRVVQRCKDSSIWKGINTKTDLYGYQYCGSRGDGYGDHSSIVSHAGDPSVIHWDDEDSTPTDDRPSTSTCFPTCTVSSINDSMVTKETNIKTEGDNVGSAKTKGTIDDDTGSTTGKSVEENRSLMIDGWRPFSVTKSVNKKSLKSLSKNVVIDKSVKDCVKPGSSSGLTGRSDVIVDSKECMVAKQHASFSSAGGTQVGKEDSWELDVVVEAEEWEDEHDILQEMSMNGLKKMFQCDFCLFITGNKSEMLAHLREALHCSASSVFASSEKVVMYLNKHAALKYDQPYPSMVAVCPSTKCNTLYKDVIECESHTAMVHKKLNLRGYCVVDVINLEYVKVPFLPTSNIDMACYQCSFVANKLPALKKHYMKKNHYPYKTRPNCDYYTACTVCPKEIFSDFCEAVHHVTKQETQSHAREMYDGKITLMVYTVSQDRKLIELPPFIPSKIGEKGAIGIDSGSGHHGRSYDTAGSSSEHLGHSYDRAASVSGQQGGSYDSVDLGSRHQGDSYDTADSGSGHKGGSYDTSDLGSWHQGRSYEWGSGYQGRCYDSVDSGSGHLGGSYSVKAENCRGMGLYNYKEPYDRNDWRMARDIFMGRVVQRYRDSAMQRGINSTETDIYEYQYCGSRGDGYGDHSSIFSHSGDPSEIHWGGDDSTPTNVRPSTSTGFPTCTVSSINDSMVTKETKVKKEGDNVGSAKTKDTIDSGTGSTSGKSVEKKRSLLIDGRSPRKNISVTKSVNKKSIKSLSKNGVIDKSVKACVKPGSSTCLTGRSDVIGDSKEGVVAEQQGSLRIAGGTQAGKDDSWELDVVVEAEEWEDEHDIIQEMSMNGLEKMFQCDFCLYITGNESEMLAHLREALHCSASSVFASSDKVVTYLNKPAALKYDHPYPSMMAVCPSTKCNNLYKDAIECESHTAMFHKKHNLRGYCVVDVINLEYVKVPFLPTSNIDMACYKCGFEANKLKVLKKHYMQKKHYPYKTRPNCDYYTACTVCPKEIFSDFCQAMHHVTKQETQSHAREIHDGKITLMVYTVSQDRKLIELPPFIPSKQGEKGAIGCRIRGLKRSTRHFVNKPRQKLTRPLQTSKPC